MGRHPKPTHFRRICNRCGKSEWVIRRSSGNSEYCTPCQIYRKNKEIYYAKKAKRLSLLKKDRESI